MDYFTSGEAEYGEFQDEKVPYNSEPSSSVDVKAIKEDVLRSNTEIQENKRIPVISGEEYLESLNSDNKVEKEASSKSGISDTPVQKESKLEESVESNIDVNEMEISKCVQSSASVGNPSNIDVSTCSPSSLIDCASSDDPNPEESSKSNISDKQFLLYAEFLSMGSEEQDSETSAPYLEETGLQIHKKKLLNLHQELKQFHSNRKYSPKDLSENKTSGASRPNEDTQPINKPITKYFSNTKLPSASNKSKESTSIASSRIPSTQIEGFILIVSSLLPALFGTSRNLETSRTAEEISSASLENHNSSLVRLEASIDQIVGNFDKLEFDELNGVIPNSLNRGQFVLNLISLFEHLLEDLFEFKAFVNRKRLASCNPCDDRDYESTLDEKLLASRTEDLGTRVESNAAQNTRPLLSELIPTRHVAAAAGTKGEPRPEATSERGFESLTKFDAEQKTVAESVESEPSVSSDSTSLNESTELPSTLALNPRLEAETYHFDVSRQLLRLIEEAGYQFSLLVIRTTEIVQCYTNSYLFLPHLETHVADIRDALEHVVSLREECSALLSRCRKREDSECVMYLLKVKTHIAAIYSNLWENLSTLTSNFNTSSIEHSD